VADEEAHMKQKKEFGRGELKMGPLTWIIALHDAQASDQTQESHAVWWTYHEGKEFSKDETWEIP
jgi:hypothetical protein